MELGLQDGGFHLKLAIPGCIPMDQLVTTYIYYTHFEWCVGTRVSFVKNTIFGLLLQTSFPVAVIAGEDIFLLGTAKFFRGCVLIHEHQVLD